MNSISTQQLDLVQAQLTSSLKAMGVQIDSDNLFVLNSLLTDFLEEKCDVSIDASLTPESPRILINDAIQFPRLITAINSHFRLNGEELTEMLESMDISLSDLDLLLNRAEARMKAFNAHPFELVNTTEDSFMIIENAPLSNPYTGYIDNNGTGIAIKVNGYYGNCEDDHAGMIAYLGDIGGELHLAVYAGANIEYPSHLIPLECAKKIAK
jgi:hypothetical protein